MNITSLYFLFDIFRCIACGWVLQLNGDVAYGINMRGVAALTLGVNSLGHVNNPICWAIIPEKTEGKTTYRETWRTVQEAAILALNTYVECPMHGCETCYMVHDLREACRIQILKEKSSFKQGRFEVDATLCDHLADFHNFTTSAISPLCTPVHTVHTVHTRVHTVHTVHTAKGIPSLTSEMLLVSFCCRV
jgi:hypothetical protein